LHYPPSSHEIKFLNECLSQAIKGPKGIFNPLETFIWAPSGNSFSCFLQKVLGSGKYGYKFRTPGLKRKKRESTPKGKS
jgi:hypothetical protein